ncbi:MAG: hypothetical protein H6739_41365 [Alphaproteobacteria bacterium]|nr:hypothetical protein [Alphaproteobacteria bacterium]
MPRYVAVLVALLLAVLPGAALASEAPPLDPAPTLRLELRELPAENPYRLSTEGLSDNEVFVRTWIASGVGLLAGGVLAFGGALVGGLIGVDEVTGVLVVAPLVLCPATAAWFVNDAPFWVNLIGAGAGVVPIAIGGTVGTVVGTVLFIVDLLSTGGERAVAMFVIPIALGAGLGALFAPLGPPIARAIWDARREGERLRDRRDSAEVSLTPALLPDDRRLVPGLALSVTF